MAEAAERARRAAEAAARARAEAVERLRTGWGAPAWRGAAEQLSAR